MMNITRLSYVRLGLIVLVVVCFMGVATSCSVVANAESTHPKKIIVWTSQEISHDPLSAETTAQHFFTALENKTLFGLTNTGDLSYELAENYEVSSDGLTITITLKEATFSDGVAITSYDVKSTLTRVLRVGEEYS